MDQQRIEFDRDGWKVEVRANGRMQISGRTPRNTQQVLFDIETIEEPNEQSIPTVAINSHGDRLELVKADWSPDS